MPNIKLIHIKIFDGTEDEITTLARSLRDVITEVYPSYQFLVTSDRINIEEKSREDILALRDRLNQILEESVA